MEEQQGVQFFGGLEQRQEVRLVPVLPVDHHVKLGALEAQDFHGPFQLGDGGVDVLRRQGGQAGEAVGPLFGHARDLVVDLLGRLDRF